MEIKKIGLFLFVSFFMLTCEEKSDIVEQKKFIVASKQINCTGVGTQKCFLIKENTNDNWKYFYSAITDFNYEEGYEYKIKVLLEVHTNTAQDDSSIEYKLLEVISKIEKTSENLPN